jgi:hypothetical protein
VEIPADSATMDGLNAPENRCQIAIVGIGESLRPRSASLATLDIALAGAARTRAEVKRFAVGELNLPFYREDLPPPTAAVELSAAAAAADGLICIGEYGWRSCGPAAKVPGPTTGRS